MLLILLIRVILLVFTGPGYGWRGDRDWGYGPPGIVGLLLVMLLVLLAAGAVPARWGW